MKMVGYSGDFRQKSLLDRAYKVFYGKLLHILSIKLEVFQPNVVSDSY